MVPAVRSEMTEVIARLWPGKRTRATKFSPKDGPAARLASSATRTSRATRRVSRPLSSTATIPTVNRAILRPASGR